jgi:5'-3' exonuclease
LVNNPLLLAKRPEKPKRTLLIDGDVLCYRIGLSAEEIVNWADEGEDEIISVWANADQTRERFKSAIYSLKTQFNADWAVLCVTLDKENFRKEILPTYKENRNSSRKPIMLSALRKFCVEHFGALTHPRLEADDILGILATGGKFGSGDSFEDGSKLGEMIIVSADKDLLGLPGKHYRLDNGPVLVQSEEAAAQWHAMQAISGDVTDNYSGCPGVGKRRAEAAVSAGLAWVPYEHTFQSGKRKGQTETRWEQRPTKDLWEIVKSHYLRAGLSEQAALVQARCAWMLRADNWNNDTQEITLWTPHQ